VQDETPTPPPSTLDEQIVIGGAMASPAAADTLATIVTTADFAARHHRSIWDAIRAVRASGDGASYDRVAEQLMDAGLLGRVGGVEYLNTCHHIAPTGDLVTYHGRRVADAGHHRRQEQQADRHKQILAVEDPETRATLLAQLGAEILAEVDRTAPGQSTRFARTVMRRSELKHLPAVEPLIEGILSMRSTVVLIGSSGSGKTFLTLAWACSIGTGTSWLGRATRREKVLYVVGEGANGLDDRITAWEDAWGAKVSDDDVQFSIRPDTLSTDATWAELQREAVASSRRVIVLDTFSSLAPDADETKDAALMMRRMSDLAAAVDGTVILVHHPGWGDVTRARGGSQLESNADEVLLLLGTKTDPLIALERKKVKEGVSGDKLWLRRKPTRGSVIIESVAAQEHDESIAATAEQVAFLVFGAGEFTRAQLRDALMERLTISASTAYEHITKMDKGKSLIKVDGKGRLATYKMKDLQ
jgi:hypothetical protein